MRPARSRSFISQVARAVRRWGLRSSSRRSSVAPVVILSCSTSVGWGGSAPLLCPALPLSFAIADLRGYARDCAASLHADPRMYGTDAAMDDADALRAALGYRRVMVYGGSYGATAALVYIARHGSHVKAAILDGATSPDVPFFEKAPQAGQAQLNLLSARCDANPNCVKTYGHLAASVSSLITRLRAHPVAATVGGGSGPVRLSRSRSDDRDAQPRPGNDPAALHPHPRGRRRQPDPARADLRTGHSAGARRDHPAGHLLADPLLRRLGTPDPTIAHLSQRLLPP